MSLADLLFDAPGGDDDVLVNCGERTLTRRELRDAAEGIAGTLRTADVRAGQPVAARLADPLSVVAALFGVWRAGAVYVPVNPRLTAPEVDRMLEATRPAAVLDGLNQVIAHAANPPTHGPDTALVQWTSGTTGPPKPVLLRHSGVLELLDGVLGTLRGSRGDAGSALDAMPNLIPVPLSLWAGIYQVLFAFRVGAPVVLMERFETKTFAALVAEYGIRSVVLPPAAMAMLADDPEVTSLAPLRYARSITAPLSPFQARRFHDRFGVAILNGYGQTEIGGEIVGWSAADWKRHGRDKLGAVGRPHAGVKVRVDEETGELLVRTPARSAGYADGADLSDRLTSDGWFRTGDVARVDADGFVWIEGRLSDVVNRGGLKMFPSEVEEVIAAAPGVREVAVVGASDERLGEVPIAFVVGDSGADALESHCRAHLAPYKVPARFVAVDELPRNEAGKVVARDLLG